LAAVPKQRPLSRPTGKTAAQLAGLLLLAPVLTGIGVLFIVYGPPGLAKIVSCLVCTIAGLLVSFLESWIAWSCYETRSRLAEPRVPYLRFVLLFVGGMVMNVMLLLVLFGSSALLFLGIVGGGAASW
jgi:hypothetical protein